MERKTEKVQGFDVDIISADDAVNSTVDKIQKKQGSHIVTINPEIIETAHKIKELENIINNAQLVIPEASGIELALKLKGIKQQRIPGIEFAERLIEEASKRNFRIALIGAKEEVLNAAANSIKNKYNDINICYMHNGYFSEEDQESIINSIVNTKPDIVFVALGSPKQDFLIQKCIEEHKDATYIGVGGSFDVWAGTVERAPEFFRKIRCEWLYRTYKQPQRIKRIYKTLPLFLIKAIIEAVKYRLFQRRINNGK